MNHKNVSRHLKSLKDKDYRLDAAGMTSAIVCVIYTMFICLSSL